MNFTCVVFGTLFTAAGAGFAAGKLHTHLEAWKAMTPEERAQIRILPLCRNLGTAIMAAGVLFLLAGLLPKFREAWFVPAMVLWLVACGADLFYIEKSRRYEQTAAVPAVYHKKAKGTGGG